MRRPRSGWTKTSAIESSFLAPSWEISSSAPAGGAPASGLNESGLLSPQGDFLRSLALQAAIIKVASHQDIPSPEAHIRRRRHKAPQPYSIDFGKGDHDVQIVNPPGGALDGVAFEARHSIIRLVDPGFSANQLFVPALGI